MKNGSEVSYQRQSGLIPTSALQRARVTLIGVGSVGSMTGFALHKMGMGSITSVDPDTVEAHNVPNQLYGIDDIGRAKVVALREWCVFADGRGTVRELAERFDGRGAEPLVVSAVDSMRSRAEVWAILKDRPEVDHYVDARMGAEVCTVYTVPMADEDARRRYESSLHSDGAGLDEPCTARGIVYTAFLAAAVVASQVKRILAKQPLSYLITVDCAHWETVCSERKEVRG